MLAMKNPYSLALITMVLFVSMSVAFGQVPTEKAAQQFATYDDFKLQSGAVIHGFRVGYRTLGTLNSEKSNAILFPSWLGGKSEDLLRFAQPGQWLDASKYYVVFLDAIGDGITTSPSNSQAQPLMEFPEFTIRDMVESELRLATDVLHLTHVHAVVGISMGGMQAFEWIVAHPDYMDQAVAIESSPQSTSADMLFWTTQIHAIELDPAWNHGKPTGPPISGLALESEIFWNNATSSAQHLRETKTKDFPALLATLAKESAHDAGAAADHIRQRQAIMNLDVPAEFGGTIEQAVARVRAKLLVMVVPEDLVVNPTPAIAFATKLGAPVILLDSPCGHLTALGCIAFGAPIVQFLADPSSVHDATLHEAPNQ